MGGLVEVWRNGCWLVGGKWRFWNGDWDFAFSCDTELYSQIIRLIL